MFNFTKKNAEKGPPIRIHDTEARFTSAENDLQRANDPPIRNPSRDAHKKTRLVEPGFLMLIPIRLNDVLRDHRLTRAIDSFVRFSTDSGPA